jgi:hypothetical protein
MVGMLASSEVDRGWLVWNQDNVSKINFYRLVANWATREKKVVVQTIS